MYIHKDGFRCMSVVKFTNIMFWTQIFYILNRKFAIISNPKSLEDVSSYSIMIKMYQIYQTTHTILDEEFGDTLLKAICHLEHVSEKDEDWIIEEHQSVFPTNEALNAMLLKPDEAKTSNRKSRINYNDNSYEAYQEIDNLQ